jgi:hypothetical protein
MTDGPVMRVQVQGSDNLTVESLKNVMEELRRAFRFTTAYAFMVRLLWFFPF